MKPQSNPPYRVAPNGKIYWCERCNRPFPSEAERRATLLTHYRMECDNPPPPYGANRGSA